MADGNLEFRSGNSSSNGDIAIFTSTFNRTQAIAITENNDAIQAKLTMTHHLDGRQCQTPLAPAPVLCQGYLSENRKICSYHQCFRVTFAELARDRGTNSVLTLG